MIRMLEISTTVGPDAFVVQRFTGREELGRLYEYHLELVSERSDITAEQMLGSNATVALALTDETPPRFFNGYVTRFVVQGQIPTPAFKSNIGYLYLVTVNPGAWFMGHSTNSRIFSQIAIGDLVKQQLQANSLMQVASTVGTTEKRDYIVQYRESDLNFVSRLMEHAGIYYYFTHENGKHTMNLLNALGDQQDTPGLAKLQFASPQATDATLVSLDLVSEVHAGSYAAGDYNYVAPNTQIAAVDANPQAHSNAGMEIYDHPVSTTTSSQATTYVGIRREEVASRYSMAHGQANERLLQVGHKIKVVDHTVDALNIEYLVVGHSFVGVNNLAASGGGTGATFMCEFEAIPASVQFRPLRVTGKPMVSGTQTALVVADFRTDTDTSGGADPIGANLGRVKVQFYWDRYGKTSCWARVSTPWAGKGYGFQNMPRIGEEVLVQFLEGDPDRPVVIGRVHNAENTPPFELPAGANYTGLKSLSIDSSGGSIAGRWNELRFDDTNGSEQVYLQAQNDFDKRVLNDDKTWIGNESHLYVKKDAYEKWDADRHVDTTGDHNEAVKGKYSLNSKSDIHVQSATMFVVDGGDEIHLKANSKIVLESPLMVSLVCGGNFVTVGPAGVDIKGMMVNVNTGGSKGSGSAIKPQPPKAHKEAMTSKGGAKTANPAAPPAPKAFSPQASSFQVAAATGAPFVASNCPG